MSRRPTGTFRAGPLVRRYFRHLGGLLRAIAVEGGGGVRVARNERFFGEAGSAVAALFGGVRRLKHIWVFDEDIDIHDDRQVEWAFGTRFQADQDMVVLTGMIGAIMDPSLGGRRTGAKAGYDLTLPFGRKGEVSLSVPEPPSFDGPRHQPAHRTHLA